MSLSLAGKVALVTGCGSPSGIGAACARVLARQGATVILTDRVGEDAASVASRIDGAIGLALDSWCTTLYKEWQETMMRQCT